jgi:hypothetical protein
LSWRSKTVHGKLRTSSIATRAMWCNVSRQGTRSGTGVWWPIADSWRFRKTAASVRKGTCGSFSRWSNAPSSGGNSNGRWPAKTRRSRTGTPCGPRRPTSNAFLRSSNSAPGNGPRPGSLRWTYRSRRDRSPSKPPGNFPTVRRADRGGDEPEQVGGSQLAVDRRGRRRGGSGRWLSAVNCGS